MIQKTLLLGLLVLCGLLLGVPALIGLYVAHNFDNYVARIDQPGVMRVIGTHFQRGWFQSQARITVQLADRFCSEPPCATLTLNSTIYHGFLAYAAPVSDNSPFNPVWVVVDSRLLLAPLWPHLVFEPSLKPVHIVTRVGIGGQVRIRAWMPSTSFSIKAGDKVAHVDMARLLTRLKTPLGQGALTFKLAWPLLRVNGAEQGHFELQGLRARLVTAAQDRRRLIEQHLRLNSLTFDNGKGLAARLEGIVWRAKDVPGEADGLATQFNLRIARVYVNAAKYGPLKAHGRIKGVDLGVWRRLRAQFISTESGQGPGTSALRALYHLYIPPILSSGPVINVRHFSLATPYGKVSGQIQIAVPDSFRTPESLSALLAHMRLEFKGRVPAALLRRVIFHIAAGHDLLGREVTSDDVDRAIKLLVANDLIQPLNGGNAYRVHVLLDHGKSASMDKPSRTGPAG